MNNQEYQNIRSQTLIVIPTYNNETTLTQVIESALKFCDQLLVVNDGATDSSAEILASFKEQIVIIVNTENLGKGKSIRKAFEYAKSHGFSYVITMDSDGQHFAKDIPLFINDILENKDAVIVGARDMESENVPGKSSFGHKFSNFWYWAETGEKIADTQSGFRLYPVDKMKNINFFTNRFEFEVEVLVRSQWNGIPVRTIPVHIFYAEPEKRISHFRPSVDFTRISVLNTVLFTIAMLYIHPRNLYRYFRDNNIIDIIKRVFSENNESPSKTANALGFGVFMGIIPIWGFQMIVATFLAHKLKLNKAIVLLAANISIPPVVPILIYLGYQTGFFIYYRSFDSFSNISKLIRHLNDNGIVDSYHHMLQSLLFYIGGSIVFAVLAGFFVWLIAHLIFSIKKSIA